MEGPIVIVVAVFAYLGWRRYLEHQQRMAAIQQGGDPNPVLAEAARTTKPAKVRKPRDHRVSGLVWMAIGIAYLVAILVSVENASRATAAGVWGLVPFSIGASLYLHQIYRRSDQAEDYRRSALVLTALGITYMICVGVSVGSLRGSERALQAGAWGLIPLAIGLALALYNRILRRERLSQPDRPQTNREEA
jgi:hypothetical protein